MLFALLVVILINYHLGLQTFSILSLLSLTALLLLSRIHTVSTMDIKHHSTFFLCKLLLIFINCFPPLSALPFGLNINLLDMEFTSVNSPALHLLLHHRSTYPLLPRSSITPILHLISNPSFAPYCHYLLLLYCLSKLQSGPGGVTPLVHLHPLLLLIIITCYNANSETPNLCSASSLVLLGNG